MKKIIALFLILIMLLSFCACNSIERKVVGTWLNPNGSVYFELMKDGKGLSPKYGPLLWDVYDDSIVVTWLITGKIVEFEYDSETDKLDSFSRQQ